MGIDISMEMNKNPWDALMITMEAVRLISRLMQ